MSGNTDFDVGNYGIEELIAIMDALDDVPLSKADIIDITQEYIDKYGDNPKFKKFFFDVRKKLLVEKAKGINESIFGPQQTELALTEKLVGERYKLEDDFLDEDKNVKVELDFPAVISKPASFIQGRLNPTYIDKEIRIVNFDSKDRTILDPVATNCFDSSGNLILDSLNSNTKLDSATNYTTTVGPVNNVIELSLIDIQIPHTWYVFNSSYGTNYFVTNQDAKPCIIEEGNYTSGNDLIDTINGEVNADISRNLLFRYHSRQNKVSVTNQSSEIVTVKWYNPVAQVALCVEGGAVGQKLDYNMGWLLGFRSPEYNIPPNGRIVGEGALDLHGPRYLILALDDFCNNKPNQSLLANKSNKQNFKLPEYYNKYTMDYGCEVPIFNTRRKGCRAITANADLSSNLTQSQRYTVDQIKLAMNGKSADRYDPPTTSDLLYRFPVNRNILSPNGGATYITNLSLDIKRIYYGPVNLNKFRVRLLDDRGLLLNLNNNDWSFTVKLTRLIKYGSKTTNDMLKSQGKMTYSAVKAAMDDRNLTEEERKEREKKLGF